MKKLWPETLDRPALTLSPAGARLTPAGDVVITRDEWEQLCTLLHAIAERNGAAAPQLPRVEPDQFIRVIQRAVAAEFGVPISKMLGKSRLDRIFLARATAMHLSSRLTQLSSVRIGAIFGRRDHGTVLHALHSIRNRMDTEPSLRATVARLETRLTALSLTP